MKPMREVNNFIFNNNELESIRKIAIQFTHLSKNINQIWFTEDLLTALRVSIEANDVAKQNEDNSSTNPKIVQGGFSYDQRIE